MTRRARTIAAFDFDGTITTGDSLKAFVLHTAGVARFLTAGVLAGPQLLGMAIGACDRGVAKAAFLRHALRGVSRTELADAARSFCASRLIAMIRPEMIERIDAHRALGHEVVLVSASPSLYLQIWASEKAGIGTVLCTQLELGDHGFTGRFIGGNCWGPEKVARLRGWWRDDPPAKLFAYGDSRGDKEMAELADVAWIRGTGPLPPLAA
ncbi:HAD-IB family hydrolase [Caballeronia sp. LZ025]|uniref:HAD-IB family hydrolase n=1 Tax=Caballeronia TaxID=1827195 RepID=UPI001FD24FBF|nr:MULTISPECIES: HAD-IB family hydrolase [Caballeronia]MDR5734723.1 HAD-IB family hydrolase [Caballeronia sp. LZ025]